MAKTTGNCLNHCVLNSKNTLILATAWHMHRCLRVEKLNLSKCTAWFFGRMSQSKRASISTREDPMQVCPDQGVNCATRNLFYFLRGFKQKEFDVIFFKVIHHRVHCATDTSRGKPVNETWSQVHRFGRLQILQANIKDTFTCTICTLCSITLPLRTLLDTRVICYRLFKLLLTLLTINIVFIGQNCVWSDSLCLTASSNTSTCFSWLWPFKHLDEIIFLIWLWFVPCSRLTTVKAVNQHRLSSVFEISNAQVAFKVKSPRVQLTISC